MEGPSLRHAGDDSGDRGTRPVVGQALERRAQPNADEREGRAEDNAADHL